MRSFKFHPEAQQEFDAAAAFYAARSVALAEDFVVALERAVALARTYADSGTPLTDTVRRVLVRRFPFGVLYRLVDDVIVILAVMHTRQRPGYWQHRQ